MLRFLLIAGGLIAANIIISYGVRYLLRERYLPYPGNWLEQALLQLNHLCLAAKDERTRYGLFALAVATAYLFASSEALSTEFYLMHFVAGGCVLLQAVYATLLCRRQLPGSIKG